MTGGLKETASLMAIAALTCVMGGTASPGLRCQTGQGPPISAAIAAPISRSALPILRQPRCARSKRRSRCRFTAR